MHFLQCSTLQAVHEHVVLFLHLQIIFFSKEAEPVRAPHAALLFNALYDVETYRLLCFVDRFLVRRGFHDRCAVLHAPLFCIFVPLSKQHVSDLYVFIA